MFGQYWNVISNLGIKEKHSELEKRRIILTNRVNLIIGAIMLTLFVIVVSISNIKEIGMGTNRLGIVAAICSLNLFLTKNGLIQLSKLSLTILVPFFILIFNLFFYGTENEFYTWYPYAAIALSVIPWLIYSAENEKIPLIISVIIIGISVLFMDNILILFAKEDLSIIPVINEFYVFYKLAQIAIYVFLNAIIIYILGINRVYEERLKKSNKTLTDQSHEIRQQADQLLHVNTELEKLSIVASKTNNAVTILDPDGKFEWINEGFTKLYGYEFKELLEERGDSFADILEEPELKEKYFECLRSKESKTCESTIVTKSGEKVWRQTTLTPILNSSQEVQKIIAIDSDITPLKQAEEKIQLLIKEIGKQRDIAVEQRDEMTDSIKYAQRIQKALLPSNKKLETLLENYFIIDFPKSIVSGDFYWLAKKGDLIIVAVADCTGHGVSGAFMSIIGTHLLDNIVNRNNVTKPSEILKILNRKLKIALVSKDSVKTDDGMDISLITINKENYQIEYAGAMRPLILFKESELIHLKGDLIPITSDIETKQLKGFENQLIQLNEGDMIYMFSDGIVDQFGGKKGKKLFLKGFKNWLTDLYHYPVEEQKSMLTNYINNWWKDSFEQIDDILILGIKL